MASNMFYKTGLLVAAAAAAFTASASANTIILNYVVTNTSGVTTTFVITDSIGLSLTGPTLISGSVTGTVTDLNGNGATVAALQGGNIYSALIDGNTVRELMDAPGYFFSTGQFLSSAAVPEVFANEVSVGVNVTIGIRLEFTLTAGDSASFTSIFTVVPAPGAMVALAGVFALGRRRRD